MAEQIPYGVAVSLINRLGSLAFREFGRIYGVSAELEKLKNTLELIQAELSDAEERQEKDRAVKIWILRLKEVLHDADNLFDDLVIEDLRRKVNSHSKVVSQVRDFFSSKNQLAFRHKIARKVEKIRQQFDDVSSDMSKLNLRRTVVISKENESARGETGSFVSQSDIIGREESKKEIIDLVKQTNTNQNVSLIAIVGIGGLGKTALAQLVYNDAELQKLFQKKMWVCVSEDFEVKTILHKMLKSLKGKEVGDLELDILQMELRQELTGQRYMLVLDDVWNEGQLKWNALRTYLMCGGEGSKILVTTRSKIVVQTMGVDFPYILKGLTKDQSWALLKNLIVGEDARRMNPNLVSIGERIAEKCGGVPLAIRTMGGLLRSKNEESEWSNILRGDFWRLCEEKDSIMPVLKLSYQNLPLGLRQCFAYCSLYPKDWDFEKNELIQLWMAQGYLESSIATQSLEDVGNQYVKILLMRSFFQDASSSEYNDITSFKMHDLMHDLAKLVAGNDCYLDGEGKGIVGRPMHISFLSSSFCSLDLFDASKVRTIIWAKTKVGFMARPSIMKNLKYLRVLDLSYSSITQLPESVDKLKHLRCLDLSYCGELLNLPESIGDLVSLQTLKLRGCRKLVFPVEIITKLICLRYLDVRDCKAFEEKVLVALGKLTSLQFLSNFLVVADDRKMKSGRVNELKDLNTHVIITGLASVKDAAALQEANLKAKEHIQFLDLHWGCDLNENRNSDSLQLLDNLCPHQNLRELKVGGYPGLRFSSWLPSLTNIVQITLFYFPNCQYLPSLERLPWLKKLDISKMDELKYMDYEETSDVFFPSLETLILSYCNNLCGWQMVGDGNNANDIISLPPFPRLSSLQIDSCPNLTCIPTFPHLVQKLDFGSSSVKPLIETCLLQSCSFSPLSGLKDLEIAYIDIEEMPEEWMHNLTSLQFLSLRGLPTIAPLVRHLQHLPVQLQELQIKEVNELELCKDEEHQAPHALHTLQSISISLCYNLKALPDQICDLQSLREIDILDCPNLESLPEGMCRLTNLDTLHIYHCPLLRDRCLTETGQDWPKIAHIPNIIIV